jgi:hypothetical protein
MKCERRDVTIAKMAGGDLPGWRTARLQRHMSACARCRGLHEALIEQRLEWRAAHKLETNGDVLAHLRAKVMQSAKAQAQHTVTPFHTVILSDSEESRRPQAPLTIRAALPGRAKLPLSRPARHAILAAGISALLIAAAVFGPGRLMPRTVSREETAIRLDSDGMAVDQTAPVDLVNEVNEVSLDQVAKESDVVIRMATNNENVVILWLGNNSGG